MRTRVTAYEPRERRRYWVSWWVGLGLLVAWPAAGQEAERSWEVYTTTGMERRTYTAPTTVEVGLPEPVELPSEVTGTGQGTRLTGVEVVVSQGVGGRPATGPSSPVVLALAEGTDGSLWVGTDAGLSRLDGNGWTTFTEEDGLAGFVMGMTIDTQGRLWTVGGGGVTCFDGRHWTKYPLAEGSMDVAAAPNGDLWVANGESALYRFDGQDWWRYGREDGLPWPGDVYQVAVDRKGVVWANVLEGELPIPLYELTAFDGHQWTSYSLPDVHLPVSEIFVDSANRIWVGTDARWLLVFDGTIWRQYTGARFGSVRTMTEDGRGRVWLVGGNAEIGYLDGPRWTSVLSKGEPSLPSGLLLDRRGNLWIGLQGGGLLKWPREALPTAIGAWLTPAPSQSLRLYEPYPNPFNQETQISFSLDQPEQISMAIYGALGQAITTVAQGAYLAGRHDFTWDGRDQAGRKVASGIYLCRLTAGEQHLIRRMVLIR